MSGSIVGCNSLQVVPRCLCTRHLGGGTFDGIRLSRQNLDNQGNTILEAARPITGFTQSPAILTYRVGSSVLRGDRTACRCFLGGFTRIFRAAPGRHAELIGLDGTRQSLDLPLAASRPVLLYQRGAYDWDLQVGQLQRSDGGFDPTAAAGARYGVTEDLSLESAAMFRSGDPY